MRIRGGHHGSGSVAPKTSPRLNHQGDLDPINSNGEYSSESTSLESLIDTNESSDNEEHHHHPLIGWLHRWIRFSGFRPVFLFEKEVTKSDTVKGLSRLLIPQAAALQKILPILTEEEKYLAMEKKSGLIVRAIDQMGRKWRLGFKTWAKGSMYVFYHTDWLEIIRKNNLAEGKVWVRVWAFRYDPPNNKLCFVIGVKRPWEE